MPLRPFDGSIRRGPTFDLPGRNGRGPCHGSARPTAKSGKPKQGRRWADGARTIRPSRRRGGTCTRARGVGSTGCRGPLGEAGPPPHYWEMVLSAAWPERVPASGSHTNPVSVSGHRVGPFLWAVSTESRAAQLHGRPGPLANGPGPPRCASTPQSRDRVRRGDERCCQLARKVLDGYVLLSHDRPARQIGRTGTHHRYFRGPP
jgi:hypothetical protein